MTLIFDEAVKTEVVGVLNSLKTAEALSAAASSLVTRTKAQPKPQTPQQRAAERESAQVKTLRRQMEALKLENTVLRRDLQVALDEIKRLKGHNRQLANWIMARIR